MSSRSWEPLGCSSSEVTAIGGLFGISNNLLDQCCAIADVRRRWRGELDKATLIANVQLALFHVYSRLLGAVPLIAVFAQNTVSLDIFASTPEVVAPPHSATILKLRTMRLPIFASIIDLRLPISGANFGDFFWAMCKIAVPMAALGPF